MSELFWIFGFIAFIMAMYIIKSAIDSDDEIKKEYKDTRYDGLPSRQAKIIGKRIEVRAISVTRTYYHITFEFDNGKRCEFEVSDKWYGALAEGDKGELVNKGTLFVKFEREIL